MVIEFRSIFTKINRKKKSDFTLLHSGMSAFQRCIGRCVSLVKIVDTHGVPQRDEASGS